MAPGQCPSASRCTRNSSSRRSLDDPTRRAANSTPGVPCQPMRSQKMYLPSPGADGPPYTCPSAFYPPERRRPPDPDVGPGVVSGGRATSRATRPGNPRCLLEARRLSRGPPSDATSAAVSPRGESGELWKAVRPFVCRGPRRGARYLRTRRRSQQDPLEVRVGEPVLRGESRATGRLRQGERRRRRGGGPKRVRLVRTIRCLCVRERRG